MWVRRLSPAVAVGGFGTVCKFTLSAYLATKASFMYP